MFFRSARHRLCAALATSALVAAPLVAAAPGALASSPTMAVNNLRTSWDPAEPGLAPSTVGSSVFGPVFSTAVDGQVYAQPITAGGTLVAATETNHVYGVDPTTGAVRWDVALGPAWPAATVGCGDLKPTIGVTATPVYDPATGTVYVSAKVDDGTSPQQPHFYLHALDAVTGAERTGWPVTISGTPSNDRAQPFNPLTAAQRPGLLLLGGVVYAGFASHCDYGPYVGYVVGVDTRRASVRSMWATETGTAYDEGGIWQSGAGLVSDGPDTILFATGNGLSPAPGPGDRPPGTLGEAVVRLHVGDDGTLAATDFFSPANNLRLNQNDVDLGAGGPLGLPDAAGTPAHPHLLVQSGKDGRVYLLDRDHLGGTAQGPGGSDDVVGVSGPYAPVYGKPAWFGGGGGYVYVAECFGVLRAHALRLDSAGTPSLVSVGTSTAGFGFASGSPVVTSVGNDPSTALVWVVRMPPSTPGTAGNPAGAELQAYDAVPDGNGVLHLRFSRAIGVGTKFTSVATDGGRVFLGTSDGHVLGFGAPTTSPVTSSTTDFGQVAVASTAPGTVHLTATRPVTVAAATTPTGSPFTVGRLALPRSLAAGQGLDVPVTFTPSAPGQVSGSLSVSVTSAAGVPSSVSLDLRGYGTRDGLLASPGTLDFGELATTVAKQLSVTLTNTGTTPATVTRVDLPGAPFSVIGAPVVGSVLAPQASLALSVLARPDRAGPLSDSIGVGTDRGAAVRVSLTGSSVAGAPQMDVPASVEFGEVPVGLSTTQDFAITNTGNAPMVVTKAKPPAGAFTTTTPLQEGLTVPPGDTVHQAVLFTPTAPGPVTESYLITADDGTGMRTVQLHGTGVDDPITAKYQNMGGNRSYLGNPLSPEQTVPGGRFQAFANGTIWASPATGAHVVMGAVLAEYQLLGASSGVLGFPLTDELPAPGGTGRYNDFAGAGGSIYYSAATGPHAVYGLIKQRWVAVGGVLGPLGYPSTDELGTPDGVGRYNHFAGSGGASVYYTPATGAHAVYGAIRQHWADTGWERGPAGYPTTDELPSPGGGRRNEFSSNGSVIDWSPATGAHLVLGDIRARWDALGAELGPLGYPLTDELPTPGGAGRYNDFARPGGATVSWSPITGAHAVYGAIRAEWLTTGRELGPLAFPVSDELGTPDGRGRFNHFSGTVGGSSVYWTPTTGAHDVLGAIRSTWAGAGWETSAYGYPVTDEYAVPRGRASRFEHGTITWPPTSGR